jgi:polyadenylate-binding protein
MNTPYASASLYVGDLASDVTEGLLFEIFNQVGPVASIRVCRDAVTRRSLGYAYVNYHSVVDAERALDTLNNTLIKAKPCRIMWSQRDPSLRKSGIGNIFIKNLDKSIDHKALYDTFSAFGNILSCKVVTDENNVSKGYGFVHYETQEAAEKAIAKVNGMMLNNQKVFVGPFIPRKERQGANAEIKFTNVFIKNLAESITVDRLKELFGQHGTIANAVIMNDKAKSAEGTSFGFVNFENPTDARKAVEALNGTVLDGKPIYCGRAQKKAEREAELRAKFEQLKMERLTKYQGVNLYVKNLDDTIDDERLKAEFVVFGNITSAKVMRDEKSGSKGFGFVCFTTPEEATRAVAEMNTRMIGTKPLYVALAQRKEVRKAQLEAQHAQRAKGMRPAPGGVGGMLPPHQVYPGPAPPVFYSQPNPAQGFVYPPPQHPQQMIRSRWAGPPQYQPIAPQGFVVSPQAGGANGTAGAQPRGPRGPQRGVPGQGTGRGQGIRRGPNVRGPNNVRGPYIPGPAGVSVEQQPPQQPQQPGQAVEPQPSGQEAPVGSTAGLPYSPEQHQALGEKLYQLISLVQPDLAGKITGMILDSCYVDEIVQLIENSEMLEAKVVEALQVLAQAGLQAPAQQ